MPRHSTCSIDGCDKPVHARGWCGKHYKRWQTHGSPHITLVPEREQTVEERFWAKVDRSGGSDACWLWTGALSWGSYGHFRVADRTVLPHRWAYEALVGPIPAGLTIDHLCRVHLCVNPRHLEPVTVGANVLRGLGPAAQNARKTHCKRDHEFTAENTYISRSGKRSCRVCRRKLAAASRART